MRRQMSKRAVLRLLDDLGAEGCTVTACLSAETLDARDYDHLLPESGPDRTRAVEVLSEVGQSGTGVAVFVSPERTVAIQPPFPLTVDVKAAGLVSNPILDLLDSEPVVGLVLLRLGRYAVAMLRGDKLLATKTDTRYVKNRHRAGRQLATPVRTQSRASGQGALRHDVPHHARRVRALSARDEPRDARRRKRDSERLRQTLSADAGP